MAYIGYQIIHGVKRLLKYISSLGNIHRGHLNVLNNNFASPNDSFGHVLAI